MCPFETERRKKTMVTQRMIGEVLRYIGVPKEKADAHLIEKVELGFNVLIEKAQPRVIYQRMGIELGEEVVTITGTNYKVKSQDLCRLFRNCQGCIVLAATLGLEVDRQIAIKQKIDMLEAMIFDACASVWIDKICDDVEAEIMQQLTENEYLTMRFSPGYGDVPLETSEKIVELLWASKKIGLTLTESQMLVPTKSITAFIGISKQKENRQKSCGYCNLVKTCMYRRRGEKCGL